MDRRPKNTGGGKNIPPKSKVTLPSGTKAANCISAQKSQKEVNTCSSEIAKRGNYHHGCVPSSSSSASHRLNVGNERRHSTIPIFQGKNNISRATVNENVNAPTPSTSAAAAAVATNVGNNEVQPKTPKTPHHLSPLGLERLFKLPIGGVESPKTTLLRNKAQNVCVTPPTPRSASEDVESINRFDFHQQMPLRLPVEEEKHDSEVMKLLLVQTAMMNLLMTKVDSLTTEVNEVKSELANLRESKPEVELPKEDLRGRAVWKSAGFYTASVQLDKRVSIKVKEAYPEWCVDPTKHPNFFRTKCETVPKCPPCSMATPNKECLANCLANTRIWEKLKEQFPERAKEALAIIDSKKKERSKKRKITAQQEGSGRETEDDKANEDFYQGEEAVGEPISKRTRSAVVQTQQEQE